MCVRFEHLDSLPAERFSKILQQLKRSCDHILGELTNQFASITSGFCFAVTRFWKTTVALCLLVRLGQHLIG